jgi:hypothetical protein
MKQEAIFDKRRVGYLNEKLRFCIKDMFKKALLLKIILLDTCINQSFGFVNRLTAKYVINFH